MHSPISTDILQNKSVTIQPIVMREFCDRYSIDIRSGIIYDYETFTEIIPDLVDGNLIVTLEDDKHEHHEFMLGDILLRMIYGYTNSKFRPNLTEFPCNTSTLSPRIHKLIEIDDRRIEINDIVYYRWLDSEYYVSTYGAVFSIPYGAFLRQHYNEKGYKHIKVKENGFNKSYKVHRLVWESYYNKIIPADKEMDHINDRRWDNVISNLQLLTHLENLQKKNPAVYKTYSNDTIINIGKDLAAGIPTKEIAEKYSISRERVWEIKFRDLYKDILDSANIDLSNVDRDYNTMITKKEIPTIRSMRESGISVKDIASTYNVSEGFIYQILSGKVFSAA